MSNAAVRRVWAKEQAEFYGDQAVHSMRWSAWVTSDASYEEARLAGHFGLIALGESEEDRLRAVLDDLVFAYKTSD